MLLEFDDLVPKSVPFINLSIIWPILKLKSLLPKLDGIVVVAVVVEPVALLEAVVDEDVVCGKGRLDLFRSISIAESRVLDDDRLKSGTKGTSLLTILD